MQIFKDSGLQEQFDKDGVVCIPAIDSSQIKRLAELYKEVKPVEKTGIYSNVQDQSAEINYRIDKEMIKVFEPFLEKNFVNYTVSGGSYLVKHGIQESASALHQDYNLVDETKFTSLSVWCPLVDVDEVNGCLQVVLGTHKSFPSIRSINIPSVYVDFDARLEPHLKSIPVKAGTAVIYAHNLFHGSKPNTTRNTRVAAVVALVPKNAERLHYLKDDKQIQVIKGEEKFFYETLPTLRAKGELVGIEPIGSIPLGTETSITKEHFYSVLKNNSKPAKGIVGFLKKLMGN